MNSRFWFLFFLFSQAISLHAFDGAPSNGSSLPQGQAFWNRFAKPQASELKPLQEAPIKKEILAPSSKAEMIQLVSSWICKANPCPAEAEKIIQDSALLHNELEKRALLSSPEKYWQSFDSLLEALLASDKDALRKLAWLATSEELLERSMGLGNGTKLHASEAKSAALILGGVSGPQPIVTNDPKGGACMDGSAGSNLYGNCSLPSSGGNFGENGDPLPTAQANAGEGGSSAGNLRNAAQKAPVWSLPGACYGLDPSKLFKGNTAGNPGEGGTGEGDTSGGEMGPPASAAGGGSGSNDAGGSDNSQGPPAPNSRGGEGNKNTVLTRGKPVLDDSIDAGNIDNFDGPSMSGAVSDFIDKHNGIGGSSVQWTKSLSGVYDMFKNGTYGVSAGGTFTPRPDGDDLGGICSQAFAKGIAMACIGSSMQSHSGGSIAPIDPISPEKGGLAGMQSGASGSSCSSSGSAQNSSGKSCPAFCLMASHPSDFEACQACGAGPGGGGAPDNQPYGPYTDPAPGFQEAARGQNSSSLGMRFLQWLLP